MATTALQIFDDARIILKDANATAWDDAKLLTWLNAGQREIASVRPDAYTRIAAFTLVAGTRQTLPTDGELLIHIPRNLQSDGVTAGRAIRKSDRDEFDLFRPDWHTETPGVTTNYVYDPYTPYSFYVYPPAVAGNKVELIYAATPPDLTGADASIVIKDSYRNALLDYVLFRSFAEDGEIEGASTRAVAHKQAFDQFLGNKARADVSASAAQAAS